MTHPAPPPCASSKMRSPTQEPGSRLGLSGRVKQRHGVSIVAKHDVRAAVCAAPGRSPPPTRAGPSPRPDRRERGGRWLRRRRTRPRENVMYVWPTETATRRRVSPAPRPKTITTSSPSRRANRARTGDRRGVALACWWTPVTRTTPASPSRPLTIPVRRPACSPATCRPTSSPS